MYTFRVYIRVYDTCNLSHCYEIHENRSANYISVCATPLHYRPHENKIL